MQLLVQVEKKNNYFYNALDVRNNCATYIFFSFLGFFTRPTFFPVFRERRRASRTSRKFKLRLGRRAALLNVWEEERAARDTSY